MAGSNYVLSSSTEFVILLSLSPNNGLLTFQKKDESQTYLNHYTTATNYFPWLSLSINLTEAYPFPEFLVVINLNQVDLMLSTKGLHQLDIHRLITVGCKHTEMGLAPKMQNSKVKSHLRPKFKASSPTLLLRPKKAAGTNAYLTAYSNYQISPAA